MSLLNTSDHIFHHENYFQPFSRDIVEDLKQYKTDPVKLQSQDISCLLYADDMLLMSESSSGLQKAIDCLGNYCEKWRMTVNCKKTKVLVFQKYGATPPN
jgi:hypothetical protein